MRHLALTLLLLAPSIGFAQDVPLFTITREGETWQPAAGDPPTAAPPTHPLDLSGLHRPTAVSPDGQTAFAAHPDGRAVWAYVVGKDGKLSAGEPYCPLRRRRGQDKVAVTGLAVDAAGRVYAATPDGVQVFDPTGRLSGVLLLPAPGQPEHLGWEGEAKDRLTVWIGGVKYTRLLNARGP